MDSSIQKGKRLATTRTHWLVHWLVPCLLCCLALISGCAKEAHMPLFTHLSPEETGITFVNAVQEQEGFNVLEYEYFYNGGGVAIGDINNDALPDVYLIANMAPDRLYLNKGEWAFVDITEQAGIQHSPSWHTGVTMVDINDDGWLDIYVSRSGNVAAERRRNQLFINNRNLTFTEQAASYGLADAAYTNHAVFFDYDLDGDLDAYLLNHSIRRLSNFLVEYMREQRDSLAGDKLMQNQDGFFVDVSAQAGIIGNPLGFGLSAVVSDINLDGWPDLYVSNDYIEDDYLYINQQDGTFAESIRVYLDHTSYSSMGADIADINHDGHPDIITLDMLAEDNYRQKILKGPEDHIFYAKLREDGFHEQYMRNMLHVSAGDDYIEVGQLAGLSNTDWSWAALFADFDLDGYQDVLITNGYLRDYTNLDFLRTTLVEAYQAASARGAALSSLDMVQHMPSTRINNYVFRGRPKLVFENRTEDWGFGRATHSNGAAYADLDADGDLDLIINNINAPADVYRNEAQSRGARSLTIRLQGPPGNRQGIGAKVSVTMDDGTAHREMIPVRGYLSSMEPILIVAAGQTSAASVTVTWPDGLQQTARSVPAHGQLTVEYDAAVAPPAPAREEPILFDRAPARGIVFQHRENPFSDFDREPLLPQLLSREGPALAVGDLNQDGLADLFSGGAQGQAAKLFLQQVDGTFLPVVSEALASHSRFEDVDACLFDYDGDLDLDLYVASGGSSAPLDDPSYQDRLYVNMGFGRLVHAPDALPVMHTSTGAVAASDFDGDGDLDLFVGGRVRPGRYPLSPRSYLLANEPEGFVDVTAERAPALMHPGLVTDAIWADLTGGKEAELILAGEWMPLRVFVHAESGTLVESTERLGLAESQGFWTALAAGDLDGDGDQDVVAGNRGLNTQIQVSARAPAAIYAADFDQSGTLDAIASAFVAGEEVLVHWRDAVLDQVPGWSARFPTYESFAAATVREALTDAERQRATRVVARVAESSVFENLEGQSLARRSLPRRAQVAPIQSIIIHDFDGDAKLDLVTAGNQFGMRAAVGRQDAGRGLLLKGDGQLSFEVIGSAGLEAAQDVRAMRMLPTSATMLVVVGNNNGPLEVYAWLQGPGVRQQQGFVHR